MRPSSERPQDYVGGKYRLSNVLYETPIAIVYSAEHVTIRRAVEFKVLRPGLSIEGPEAARLVREARAAGSVAHRNVQSVVDSGTDARGAPYVVYEALEGVSLAELLTTAPDGLPIGRALRMLSELLEGLAAVHRGGVVHRAVSPHAMMVVSLRAGGELVKLRAFDEAVFQAEGKATEPSLTPALEFRAPELTRPASADPRADVYAAGVLLRLLLTGSAQPSAELPDAAERVIEHATATDPDERFPDADTMLSAVLMVRPSSQRPSLADRIPPSDLLLGDLHFLRRRAQARPTRETPSSARLHLRMFLIAIEAFYRRLGEENWSRLVAQLPQTEALLPGSGDTSLNMQRGVPADLLTRLLRAADRIAGTGDFGVVVEVGEAIASRGLNRVNPTIPEAPTVDELNGSFAQLWSGIALDGVASTLDQSAGASRLAVRGTLDAGIEIAALLAGMLRGALQRAGGPAAEVRITASEAAGDHVTIYRLRW